MNAKTVVFLAGVLSCGLFLPVPPDRLSSADTEMTPRSRTQAAPSGLPAPRRIVLPDGLTVILQEDHRAPVAAVQMWVKAGSGDETDPQAGLSHVLEHMLFKGTEKRGVGDIAREVEQSGGRINAFTSYDETVFHLTVPAENLKTGVDLIADSIQHSALDPSELKKELEVVMEEVRRQEDMPDAKLENALFSEAYTVHPYRRPVIGYSKTLEGMDRDRIVAYYRRWYVPNNMVLVISGDFDPRVLLPYVRSEFAGFSRTPLPRRPRPAEPPQAKMRETILEEDIKEAHFVLGYHIPGIKSPDIYALDVLAQILGGGKGSRLVRRVQEEGQLVNSISAYSYTPRDPGLFLIDASLESNKAGEALDAVLRETALVSRRPVDDDELSRAKINLVSQFTYEAETAEGVAHQLGNFEVVTGDLGFRDKYVRRVEAVTKDDVLRVAKKYLVDSNLSAAGLFPKGQAPKSLSALLAREAHALKVKTVEDGPDGVKKVTFENGPILLIKEDHSEPVLAVRAVFAGGERDEEKGKEGEFNFMAGMLTRGTRMRDAETLAKDVEAMAGSLDAGAGRTHFSFAGKVLSRFTDRYLDMFFDAILHPAFDPAEAEKERREILMDLKNQEDSLSLTAFRTFSRTLYGDHPLGRDPLGTTGSVSALRPEDLRDLYGRYARTGGLILSVVGDISPQHIISAVSTGLSELPAGAGPGLRIPPPEAPVAVRTAHKAVEGKEQDHLLLGFLGTTITSDDRYPLLVLTNILANMGGRLFVELRDKRSLAYAVTAILAEGITDPGYVAVYLACQPKKLGEAVDESLAVLKGVVDTGVTEEEVRRAKSFLVGNHLIGLQGTSAMASTLAFNEAYGLGYGFYAEYPKRIEAVTKDDVLRVARKYLALDRYTLAVVGPDRSAAAK